MDPLNKKTSAGKNQNTANNKKLNSSKKPFPHNSVISTPQDYNAFLAPSLSSEQPDSLKDQKKTNTKRAALAHSAYVHLNTVDKKRFAFSKKVVDKVNPYFEKPYEEASSTSSYYSLKDEKSGKVVFRPNHSLAHGLRQGYLAVDLVRTFKHHPLRGLGTAGKALGEWIQRKAKKDPLLFQKIEFANSFQRSGRQSEASRDNNAQKFEAYLKADQDNLQAQAQDLMGAEKLFTDQTELNLYKAAIASKFANLDAAGGQRDLYFLSKILYTAHLLDLRRIPHFSKARILEQVALELFDTKTPSAAEKELMDQLWARSGAYLEATGDRDMEDKARQDWDTAVFTQQAHEPEQMIKALQLARTQPQKKLLESIVHHAAVVREIKTTAKAEKPDLLPSIFRNTLKNAPYTASEGYLKLLLKEQYREIPQHASDDKVREITQANILIFLSEKKKAIQSTRNGPIHLEERIKNPDKHYINSLLTCMLEERKHKEKVVFYHATEPEMAFMFDVFSYLRKQLALQGGDNTSLLRAVDNGFLALDYYLKEAHDNERPATVTDFMKKFKGVADDDSSYRDMVLSTNFGLFGSDLQKNADTYNMFYEVKDRKVATQLLVYEKFFDFLEQKTGIPFSFESFKPILEEYILQNPQKEPCRNGKLLQIFIDPAALADTSYFSVLMGAPVLKDGSNPPLEEPITLLRTRPEALETYLKGSTGETQMMGVPSHLLRPSTLELHDLQARIYMRPEVMLDENLTQIKSYWRFETPEKTYHQAIQKLVNQNLTTWLSKGSPADPDAFAPKTEALSTLAKLIHKETTGVDAPKAPALSKGEQWVKLLLSDRIGTAARFLEDHYEALRTQTFRVLPDKNGRGGGMYDLRSLLMRYKHPELLEIAFKKGLFPGGDKAYALACKLNQESPLDVSRFLEKLLEFQDADRTLELFETYFKDLPISSLLNILSGINEVGNEESILKQAQTLMPLIEDFCYDRLLMGIKGLAENTRKDTCTAALERLPKLINNSLSEKVQISLYIQNLLYFIQDTSVLNKAQQDALWELSKTLKLEWDFKLKALNVLKYIDWKAVQEGEWPQWPRAIRAPFTVNDILDHAKTDPSIYEIAFLKSKAGKAVLQVLVDKINAGFLPVDAKTQNYPPMVSAYNKTHFEAKYNQSLLADYVSDLKRKALSSASLLEKL